MKRNPTAPTYVPRLDPLTRTEAESLILTDLDFDMPPHCELDEHAQRCMPNDQPAVWFAIGGCPHCKREINMLVCEPGRRRKVTAPLTGCTICGGTYHWPAAITMIRMM